MRLAGWQVGGLPDLPPTRQPVDPPTRMLILELYVFVRAGFIGYMVIQRVPPLLHTPLMAATNMISGISLVGSLIAAGSAHNRVATILGFVAVVFATSNIVGGFLITDRMLKMFKRETKGDARGKAK